MNLERVTLIDDGRVVEGAAAVTPDGIRLSPAGLEAALGWALRPEGLCRGAVCVPTRGHPDLVTADGVDLVSLAALLDRPLALDPSERIACLGVAAAERATRLASLEAPDFTLPDLHGTPHTLSAYRGRKVFLLAYASW
jgi:hypothetical protein